MLMNNLEAIENQIVMVLRTVSDFKKVYDHEPLEIFELPAASIFYTGFSSDEHTMPNSQEITENWIIRIYVKLDDAKKAQLQIKQIIPKIRSAFRQNRSLSGTCFYTNLKNGDVFAVLDKNNAQLIAELALSVITREVD